MVPRIPPAISKTGPHEPHHHESPPNWTATNPTTTTRILQTIAFIRIAPAKPTTPKTINTVPNTIVLASTLKGGTRRSDSRPVISRTPPTSVNTPPSTASKRASCRMFFEAERPTPETPKNQAGQTGFKRFDTPAENVLVREPLSPAKTVLPHCKDRYRKS